MLWRLLSPTTPPHCRCRGTCGSLLSRVPPPILAVVCSWLECVNLLTFFRANRSLVAIHHQPPARSTFASSSAPTSAHSTALFSSQWADWAAAAWYHARLMISPTRGVLFVKQFQSARRGQSSPGTHWAPLFPIFYQRDQPAHLRRLIIDANDDKPALYCRHVLAATPHLRHLRLEADSFTTRRRADMADALDLLPALRTLVLTAEVEEWKEHEPLYVPLPEVLARHPRLHTIRCEGGPTAEVWLADIAAIASHPALVHIVVEGCLHVDQHDDRSHVDLYLTGPGDAGLGSWVWQDPEEYDSDLDAVGNPPQYADFSPAPCSGCALDSLAARLALLRWVQERCTASQGSFQGSDSAALIEELIVDLEGRQAAAVA